MRILGLCLVKNEADIIRTSLRESLKWCDRIFVFDNGSTDGTWERVEEAAGADERVVAFKQDPRPFDDALRAEIFNAFRTEAETGDWWCRLDADEFYIDDPRAFLDAVPKRHHVVWCVWLQYFLTAGDLLHFNTDCDEAPPEITPERFPRYYQAVGGEPRFFRHRERLQWRSGAWPAHLGVVEPRRIRVKHVQYRSPAQIQRRLATRREAAATGWQHFGHSTQETWREKIADAATLTLDQGDGVYTLDETALNRHLEPAWQRAVKLALHGNRRVAMNKLAYSIVIATYERADALRDALESVKRQTKLPERVIIVDSSAGPESEAVARESTLPITYQRAERPSAAMQRNQGFREVTTPLVAFIDDDVVLAPDVFEKLCKVFDHYDDTGGVAARMNGAEHRAPNRRLRKYYRLQAGFDHPTYGAKLFGAAINCFPCYSLEQEELIPADWLNLGCVVFRSDLFGAELFPFFKGYSYGEDVHLSARIGQKSRLYFHSTARYDHFPSMSPAKRSFFKYARMSARHRRLIARDIQGLHGWELCWKDTLHRLFVTIFLLRTRPAGWLRQIAGNWT
jgi:GT2 family glycosyltransferase